MQRKNIRGVYSHSQKVRILQKSNGVCAHCGRHLKIGSNFSIDHVVPLSKGGTNHKSNLVALCKECNEDKSNVAYNRHVVGYFKYLNKEALHELLGYIKGYEKRYKCADSIGFNHMILNGVECCTALNVLDNSQELMLGKALPAIPTLFVRNAKYSDLDEVLDFYRRRRDMLSYQTVKELKELLMLNFTTGCVITGYNHVKELVATISVTLDSEGNEIIPTFHSVCINARWVPEASFIFALVLDNITDYFKNVKRARILLKSISTLARIKENFEVEGVKFYKKDSWDVIEVPIEDEGKGSIGIKRAVNARVKMCKTMCSKDFYNRYKIPIEQGKLEYFKQVF